MTYVINEKCMSAKNASCVSVCPVDCIHPTAEEDGFAQASQLYINPDDCIDCGACVNECPVDAITADFDVPADMEHMPAANAAFFEV